MYLVGEVEKYFREYNFIEIFNHCYYLKDHNKGQPTPMKGASIEILATLVRGS